MTLIFGPVLTLADLLVGACTGNKNNEQKTVSCRCTFMVGDPVHVSV